jgi:hypothetical protein
MSSDDGGFRSFGEIDDDVPVNNLVELKATDNSKGRRVEALRNDILGSYEKFLGPYGERPGKR